MATVTTSHASRKVFFAQLDGLSGTLAKLEDGQVYCFHAESGDLRPVTSYKGLMVLGEGGVAQSQYILDEIRGIYAKVA
jgi:hypothetical protein